jgi:CRP-like cAMP-binding protein/Fe-S-cluster-containing dehydrogenase component
LSNAFFDLDAPKEDEEGLFARDFDGQLIRFVAATDEDYKKDVSLTIDGQAITVKQAVPSADSQGNILTDADGNTIPRRTTIYDAARALFVKKMGDVNPIPTLCHQEHMTPAGVCRICVVEVLKDGKRDSRLLPACQHRVEPGMAVHTLNSPDGKASERVRTCVKVLTELLVADHLRPEALQAAATGARPLNELEVLAARDMGASVPAEKSAGPKSIAEAPLRFSPRTFSRGDDNSSMVIAVDHDSCILCERCVRACTEVKQNYVISRTGKGYTAKIGFDLNDPMGQSSCVSCGECMISCPTDALTFRNPVRSLALQEEAAVGAVPVSAAELKQEFPLFSGLPYKFLQWNAGSVIRRYLKPGDVLCREGDYGSTAFILVKGRFEISIRSSLTHVENQNRGGMWGILGRITSRLTSRARAPQSHRAVIRNDGNAPLSYSLPLAVRTPEDLIIGEMTCMSHYPRSATVVAMDDAEVLEIRRNVLHMLQRNPIARELLNKVYRERALLSHLQQMSLLADLNDVERRACADFLREKVDLIRVEPGQVIFRQGDPADHFYMVRLGFVKVSQHSEGGDRVVDYLGPGRYFGEIGLLSRLTALVTGAGPAPLEGMRTATCTALDDVELVRIQGRTFRQLVEAYPRLRERLLQESVELLKKDAANRRTIGEPLGKFLDDGLFEAQNLLVLDLESCTRCDECTKACADTHDDVTRLIREGLRFDRFLVASSCRSCLDPYCLVGCPVDAIHREHSKEIRIEDHCIGCGLCAQNCPYGNINMHEIKEQRDDPEHPGLKRFVMQQKATTCDMCRDVVGPGQDPSCVYACPHNAAFRMSGPQLMQAVKARLTP